jgi:hypothetical protein
LARLPTWRERPLTANVINFHEDLTPSKSRLIFVPEGKSGLWILEVRSENHGYGTLRYGELILRGSLDGVLTARIDHASK